MAGEGQGWFCLWGLGSGAGGQVLGPRSWDPGGLQGGVHLRVCSDGLRSARGGHACLADIFTDGHSEGEATLVLSREAHGASALTFFF